MSHGFEVGDLLVCPIFSGALFIVTDVNHDDWADWTNEDFMAVSCKEFCSTILHKRMVKLVSRAE